MCITFMSIRVFWKSHVYVYHLFIYFLSSINHFFFEVSRLCVSLIFYGFIFNRDVIDEYNINGPKFNLFFHVYVYHLFFIDLFFIEIVLINTTSINQNLFFSLKVSPYVYHLFFIDLFLIEMVLINTKSVNQNRICWNMSVRICLLNRSNSLFYWNVSHVNRDLIELFQ